MVIDKKNLGLGVGVLVLILIFVFAFRNKSPQTSQTTNPANNSQGLLQMPSQPQPTKTVTNPAAVPVRKLANYSDALNAYPNRFQFSQCQGTPSSISIKRGGIVMLDNRDAVSRTIKINTQTFKIAGYGYALYNSPTAGTFNVLCDGNPRVVLNVEK